MPSVAPKRIRIKKFRFFNFRGQKLPLKFFASFFTLSSDNTSNCLLPVWLFLIQVLSGRLNYKAMPRNKDEPPAVRVYTVCDESRYLIVRNVPALGCGDELLKLFSSYGDVQECKPMDAEDCEPFTDVYWIKFRLISNSRFAKRKLDEYVFLGNRLQVFYAPQFETLSDTKDKLECRRKEVLARLSPGKSKGLTVRKSDNLGEASVSSIPSLAQIDSGQRHKGELELTSRVNDPPITRISTDKDYFGSQSMNHTVQLVREKLNKIESTGKHLLDGPSLKRTRLDNRRRI